MRLQVHWPWAEFSGHRPPAACSAAAVWPDQPQTWPQLAAGKMSPAAPDDAPGAAPIPAFGTRQDERRRLKNRAATDGRERGSSGLIAAFVLTGLCQVEAVCSSDCWRAGPSPSAARSGSGSARSWLQWAPCRMTAAPHGGHGSPSWALWKKAGKQNG